MLFLILLWPAVGIDVTIRIRLNAMANFKLFFFFNMSNLLSLLFARCGPEAVVAGYC